MDCPRTMGGDGWKVTREYNVSMDIHGLSMVHCTHRYPWTVHGTLYPQISMDCPWYIVPTDIHGLSMVHCIHMHTDIHRMSHTFHGRRWLEKLPGNTLYPWISMDCPRTSWGRWLEKLLGNTMYSWISMDCLRTSWAGEMAGKVAREYIVSMDPSFHGLSHGGITHSMGISIASLVPRPHPQLTYRESVVW